ncbi:MAG: hypothetical protein NVSMB52_10690 [Chloroflexota bacterium]
MKAAMHTTEHRGQHGFTLVELLVGITIAVIVSAAAFATLTGSSKAARVSNHTAQTQQSARIARELLSHDLKMAGYGMPGPIGNCATAMVPNDNNVTGADTGPDSVSLVVPTTISSLTAAVTAPFGPPANPLPLVSGSGFTPNAIISIGGVTSGTIASVSGNTLSLVSTVAPPAVFPVNTPVYLLTCVTYQVIRATDANAGLCGGNIPCLVRGIGAPLLAGKIDCNGPGGATACVAIAEGVEDLQIAYGCDGCNAAVNGGVADNVIDDQGPLNNVFDLGDFVSNTTWTTAPMTADTIRLALVTIVARETRTEQGFGEGNSTMANTTGPVIVQDHDPSTPGDPGYAMATYQQFRRRVVTRTIEVRNIGL